MASLGISPDDLVRTLYGSRSALLPAVQRQVSSPQMALMALAGNAALPNNGSSNRVGFGLSDFTAPSVPAPNVAGASKHPVGINQRLQQAAIAAITSQYGPVLGQLNNAMGQVRGQAAADRTDAQNRGNRAEGDLAVLYSRLRQYAGNTQRGQDQSYRQGVQNTKSNFNNLRQDINASYTGSSGAVSNELKRMGIDPAVALAGAGKDMAFTNAMVREDRANQINNTRSSQREYDAGMGNMKNDIIATGNAAIGSARSQTNAQIADINKQLSQSILQLQMQKAQTVGQRAAALSQYKLSQLQAQAGGKDPSKQADLMLKQIKIAQQLGQIPIPSAASNAATSGKPGSGMADALAQLNSIYPDTSANWSQQKKTQMAQFLQAAMNQGSTAAGMPLTGGKKGQVTYWDKKSEGDVLNALLAQMAAVKGPKGNPMYGAPDQQAMQQALMIALGMA